MSAEDAPQDKDPIEESMIANVRRVGVDTHYRTALAPIRDKVMSLVRGTRPSKPEDLVLETYDEFFLAPLGNPQSQKMHQRVLEASDPAKVSTINALVREWNEFLLQKPTPTERELYDKIEGVNKRIDAILFGREEE